MNRRSRATYEAALTPRRPAALVNAHALPPKTDLAFADTVVVDDLDEAIPASGIVISDDTGAERHMVPILYPPHQPTQSEVRNLSPSRAELDGSLLARIRGGVEASRAELSLLWNATAAEDDPSVSRRVKTLLSFFEWDRADLLRAAWIGLAVFFVAATLGALALEV